MRIKRVLQGTALTALAAVAWAGVGTTDAAAEVVKNPFPVGNVYFNLNAIYDYDDDGWEPNTSSGNMWVDVPEGSKEIMVGIASYNKNKGTVKIADTAWEVHDVKYYDEEDDYGYIDTIDLSKLSVTKDNYIAVKSDSTDPVYFRISPSIVKQKYEYRADTNTITLKTFTPAENAKDLNADNTTLLYRTQCSGWNKVPCYTTTTTDGKRERKFDKDSKIFQEYQYQGATLYLRIDGQGNNFGDMTADDLKASQLTNVKDAANNNIEYPLYNAGYMPSKEVKLNIAKQANGPSVSANYVTGEVKIPNNTEYRVIASGGAMDKQGTEKDPYSKGSGSNVKVADLLKFATGATSGTIEVRKAPVSTGKGKAASKWTRVSIEIPDPIDVTGATQKGVAIAGELNKDTVISATAGVITLKDKTTIEATKNNRTGAVNGVKVTVSTDCKYGVVVTVGSKTVTVKNDGKAKTIKATAGAEVKIHKAGDKKTKAWANDASQDKVIGKVQ